MSKVSNQTTVTLKEFADLVFHCGKNVTFIGQGEPGIGKSAMLKELAKRLPDYEDVYLDAALMDVGDMQMPNVSKGAFDFIPNGMFVSKTNKPKLIMIDEFGKGNPTVQNALLSLIHERRVGNYWLPEGSIIFATTNLGSDGLGDMVQAHAINRVCVVTISKPTADEWLPWATSNDVDPVVCAWVQENPHCLASYTDPAAKDNPYCFNPNHVQTAFVSNRSLEGASDIMKQRKYLSPNALLAALAGRVGEAAAADMETFITMSDKLIPWDVLIEDPENAELPPDTISQIILTFKAATRITKKELPAWITYLDRMGEEAKVIFFKQVMANDEKRSWMSAGMNGKFGDMMRDINWMVTGLTHMK